MSAASRMAERPPWLVRLACLDGGGIAGAGVLIDERHVVTCAHVVAQQLDQSADTACTVLAAPEGEVPVELPFADNVVVRRAAVVGWQPIKPDGSGDAAVLRLDEPVTLTPAPLACPPSLSGHRFSVHGFPRGEPPARQATGVLGGASGPAGEWIQIESVRSTGWPVEHGFSGAPIFDHDAEAVVGIVALRDQHRSGHMLPVSYLRTLWPQIGERVGWRLDLDPSLTTHWLPRARGSEVESDTGDWYFTGRHEARQAICDWLSGTTGPEHSTMLVTGGPGTGKSALLSHLLVAADPVLACTVPASGPSPPIGSFDAAIHVKGLTRDEVVERLAAAAGVAADTPLGLLAAIRESRQTRQRPFVVVADAVEEAVTVDDARRIAALLRDLSGTRAVRVLAGVRTAPAGSERARVLAAFGRHTPHIDLESRRFLRRHDIADYVQRRLTSEVAERRYQCWSLADLRTISRAVARKAGYNFLIAQLTSRWLAHPSTPLLDLADLAWDRDLPETIGQAMDAYLDTCGPDTALVRRLLTALAFARGDGLARDRTWLTITDALHPGLVHTSADLETVFHSAASYLVERSTEYTAPGPTYRLYHDALDQHLRDCCTRPQPQQAIITALTSTAPVRDGHRDWAVVDGYTRTHLAGHAATAEHLDTLLTDTDYLIHASPGPLLAVLPHVTTEQGHLAAAVYGLSSDRHRAAEPRTRCWILALDAARLGAHDLLQRLNVTLAHTADASPRCIRRVRFATGSNVDMLTIAQLNTHTPISAIAVGDWNGRLIAVTGGIAFTGDFNQTLRVWDIAEQCQLGDPLSGQPGSVTAVALGELDGRLTAVTGGFDQTVRVWDIAEQCQLGGSLSGHTGSVTAVALGELDGRLIAITGGSDHTVRVWDVAKQRQLGDPLTGPTQYVTAVALGELDGRLVAVTNGQDGTVRVWDVAERRQIGDPLSGHTGRVTVALGELDGRLIAITGGSDHTVRVWDVAKQRQLGDNLVGHTCEVNAVDLGEVDGRLLAVTSDREGTARVWDVANQRQLGDPITGRGPDGVRAVALVELAGRPVVVTAGGGVIRLSDVAERRQVADRLVGHAGHVTVVALGELGGRRIAATGGEDRTVRFWDVAEQHQIGDDPLICHTGVTAVALGQLDGRLIAIVASDTVRVWDVVGHRQIGRHFPDYTCGVTAVALGMLDERLIAVTSSYDGTVRVWDVAGQRQIRDPLTGHTGSVTAVALGELDGRLIAVTGGEDSTVRVWDVAGQRQIGRPLTGHTGRVTAVSLGVLDGQLIAVTGGSDSAVRVWDLARRRKVGRALTGHTSDLWSMVAVAELDGRVVAVTNSRADSVLVWDLTTGDRLDELVMPGLVSSLALNEAGTLVVGFGNDIAVFDTTLDLHPANPTRFSPGPLPVARRQSRPDSRRRWWQRILNR